MEQFQSNQNQKPWVLRHLALSIFLAVIGVVVLAVLWAIMSALGLSSARMGISSGSVGAPVFDAGGYGMMREEAYPGDGFKAAPPSTLGTVTPQTDRKIVRNASLSIIVKKVEDAVSRISGIALSHQGFVASSQVYESGANTITGQITIRVPEKDFIATLDAVKGLATKVNRENTNADDVTEQYIDLEARLKNQKAAEEQYLSILKQAKTIEDILKVQQLLTQTRGQIEQLEGQLTYLSRQVDMSTISVTLVAEADVKIAGVVWSPWKEIKEGFNNMLQSVINFADSLIAILFWIPGALLWLAVIVLVVYFGWKGVAFGRRKMNW